MCESAASIDMPARYTVAILANQTYNGSIFKALELELYFVMVLSHLI